MANEIKSLKEKLADLEKLKTQLFTATPTEQITLNENQAIQLVDLPISAQAMILRLDRLKQDELDLQNELLKVRYAVNGLTALLGQEITKSQESNEEEDEVEVEVPASAANEVVKAEGEQ